MKIPHNLNIYIEIEFRFLIACSFCGKTLKF